MYRYDMITWIVAVSVALHALLLAYGLHHDANTPSGGVKYTDVDYSVFTDAARCLLKAGGSPFDRPTYRYTPLLAWILYPGAASSSSTSNSVSGGRSLEDVWGKIVFSTFDVAVGFIAYKIVAFQNQSKSEFVALVAAAIWLLNPIVIVVSTRGNAESVVAFLVIASMYCVLKRRTVLGGVIFGLAVHFKIYPIIYAAPFYFAFGRTASNKSDARRQRQPANIRDLFWPNEDRLRFAALSIAAFLLPTIFFYAVYGQQYLDEAFLYHVRRSDVKHNFSPYFYMMYLLADHRRAADWLSLIAFVPQAVTVLLIALKYSGPRHLPFCMFLQTFAFVALNKVCTSQYFLWYLCLLPTVIGRLDLTTSRHTAKICAVLGAWISSQAAWLYAAYLLEFRGQDTIVYVWSASLCFLLSNVYAMYFFISTYIW